MKSISFLGALALMFIFLKLTKFICWSWLAVLSPIWVPICLVVATGFFIFVVCWRAAKKSNTTLNEALSQFRDKMSE